jgi:hypothetical protein
MFDIYKMIVQCGKSNNKCLCEFVLTLVVRFLNKIFLRHHNFRILRKGLSLILNPSKMNLEYKIGTRECWAKKAFLVMSLGEHSSLRLNVQVERFKWNLIWSNELLSLLN